VERGTVSKVVEQLSELLETHYCDAENAAEHGSHLKELADTFLKGFNLEDEARIHGALSDMNRLKILKLLGFREMCVCELTAALDMNQPNLSYHIKKLESAGLVRSEKRGKWVYYSISS
jgi:DNA-binding transcriptional ArsR family regulator